MIGETIAHYHVTAKIGEGGMGEVYRATDTKLHREVAIKVLPQSFSQDAERMERFDREAYRAPLLGFYVNVPIEDRSRHPTSIAVRR
jgi:serine/threonine protein kinase